MTWAVITTGGKQYLVKSGQVIRVEKVSATVGGEIKLDALMKFSDQQVEIGTPKLTQTIMAKVLSEGRLPKIDIIKFKRKVRYRRKAGHRQGFHNLEISKI